MNTIDKDTGSTGLLVALLAQKLGKENVAKLTGFPEDRIQKVIAANAGVLAAFTSGKTWTPVFNQGIGIILQRLFNATRGNLSTISDATRIPPAHLIKMGEQFPETGGAAEAPSPTNKVEFVIPVSRRDLARNDGGTGRGSCLIVTGGDNNYFGMVVDLIASIRRFPDVASHDIAVMDLGLEEAQRAQLNEQGCFIIEPVDVRKNGCSLSGVLRGQISRTFLPKLVPGYDQYMWMDGDTWLNDVTVIESYCQAATKYGFAITPEVSRCYDKDLTLRENIKWQTGCYQRYFGTHLANALGVLPVINSGVFCTRADSNVLLAWRKRIYQALSVTREEGDDLFMLEQTAGNVAMYLDVRDWAALPARYNWICSRSAPMLDKERGVFVEPSPPYDPIGIVHMTYRTKNEAIAVPLKSGSPIKVSLRFRDIRSFLQLESDRLTIREYAGKILGTKPIVCDTEGRFELHTLACQQDLGNALWSLKSFYHYSEIRPRLVIYDDGSLSKDAISIFSDHFLNCQIIRRDRFHRDMEGFLKAHRSSLEHSKIKSFYCALKLFGPMYYTKSEHVLYLDSDVLFFQKPREILKYIENGTPFYTSDYQNAYSNPVDFLNNLLNIDLVHKINAGLFYVAKRDFVDNMDLVESYFEKVPDLKSKDLRVNRHEQTLAAILLSKANAVRLSSGYQISKEPVTDKTISHHFVNDGSRPNFNMVGLKWLKSAGFIEEFERRA